MESMRVSSSSSSSSSCALLRTHRSIGSAATPPTKRKAFCASGARSRGARAGARRCGQQQKSSTSYKQESRNDGSGVSNNNRMNCVERRSSLSISPPFVEMQRSRRKQCILSICTGKPHATTTVHVARASSIPSACDLKCLYTAKRAKTERRNRVNDDNNNNYYYYNRCSNHSGGASVPLSVRIRSIPRSCAQFNNSYSRSQVGRARVRSIFMASKSSPSSGPPSSSPRYSPRSAPITSSSPSSPSVVMVAADLKGKERSKFMASRLRVFFGILIGYSCYYLTRNSLNFTAPVMVASPDLNLDISSIGVITSVFPLFYGCSKFVSGVVGDRLSPRIMLAGGLFMTSIINILFGFSSTLQAFCVLWAMNGILQGFGAPSCAKILTSWFASKERGTYWGMWNIAHNLGGFAAPLVAGTAARNGGWSWGLWAPGLTGVIASSMLVLNIRDSPEQCGFPPAEAPDDADKHNDASGNANTEEIEVEEEEEKPPLLKTLFDNVLSNPRIWCLALVYFCVYIVRQGITSWSVFYLINAKGAADAAVAALRVSGLELGGLAGSLLAGKLSDYLIKKAKPGEGLVGKRIRVVSGYLVGIAAMLTCFWAVPSSQPIAQWLIVFMIGFFLYGPQMLIGLCGAEIVGRESVGASEGFLGWVAYLGAANAGIPLSLLVKKLGWSYFFITLIIACGIALLLLIPLANAKSFIQREDDDAPALA